MFHMDMGRFRSLTTEEEKSEPQDSKDRRPGAKSSKSDRREAAALPRAESYSPSQYRHSDTVSSDPRVVNRITRATRAPSRP